MLPLPSNELTQVQLSFNLRCSLVKLPTIVFPCFGSGAEAVKEETHPLYFLCSSLYCLPDSIVVLWLLWVKLLRLFSLTQAGHESEQVGEKQARLEEALV